jgi:hypothetical protein
LFLNTSTSALPLFLCEIKKYTSNFFTSGSSSLEVQVSTRECHKTDAIAGNCSQAEEEDMKKDMDD